MVENASWQGVPGGTVTFLFSDIEGSTELLKRLRDQYAALLADHRRILRAAVERWGGREVDTQGDAFFFSFPRATDALAAAVAAQRALASHHWPEGVEVRVRMGLHTGEPLVGEEGYVGMDVHRAARIAHAGHGGQVLLSETTTPLVQDQLPEGVEIIDLGRHRLKDMRRPERIAQLVIDGLPAAFPPLDSIEALPPEFPREFGPVELPAFLDEGDGEPEALPVFVGRERELRELMGHLEQSLAGDGRVVLLEGGAGRGKTALMGEFSRRAMKEDEWLLAIYGSCSAFTGAGDPYLPFREAMAMLAGEVEERWRANAIDREQAARLWKGMPQVARALVEHGRDLVGVFVSGGALLARLHMATGAGGGWIERLGKLAEGERTSRPILDRTGLFEQYESVVSEVAKRQPVLLLLDDLQWADSASVDMLFHLGRRLNGRRILILGAYRPEEVAGAREQDPHSLAAVIPEFKRLHGEILIDIGCNTEEEERQFVTSYLDLEPNHLPPAFRERLYQHTRGHPLFTVEVLRNLQERGDLRLDPDMGWVETRSLEWDVLPARVEGVIEERIDRLDPELREMLRIASVEGAQFTAQVLVELTELDARDLSEKLHQELERRHRLVQEDGFRDVDGRRLHRYRFRHDLFQQHVYSHLGEFERSELHARVGGVLEGLYGDEAENIAPQLARHFLRSGQWEKAVRYLLISGDRARMLYANREAVQFYTQALEYLRDAGRREEAVQTLLKLGLVHTAEFDTEAAETVYARAFALLDEMPEEVEPRPTRLPGAELRMAAAEPAHWDPVVIDDDISCFVVMQLFEGLTEVAPDQNVIPAAAGRWEVGEGGRRYTFHLRPNLSWSDGSPLTAQDFEYAWRRNLMQEAGRSHSNLLSVIRGSETGSLQAFEDSDALDVRSVDDHTLQVRLTRPSAYFPQLMALPEAFPAPRWNVEGQGGDWPDPNSLVCNGAYTIEDWRPGEHLVLSRNPQYSGRFPGNVERVDCAIIRDFELSFDAYASGDLDIVSMIAADAKTMARAQARFPEELHYVPYPSTFYLTFLANRPPFDDVRVRKAFIHAVDRERLIQETSRGQYRPAAGGFVPPGMPGHSEGIGLPFDPDRARQYMRAAGFGRGTRFPPVTLLTSGGGKGDPNVRFLSRAWGEHLGVEVIHESVDWGEFLRRGDHDPAHLSLSGCSADYPDPDCMLRVVFHSTEGFNALNWSNDRFDALVEAGARALDQTERIRLYREADRILVAEEAAVMPLGYAMGRYLSKPWVKMPKVAPHMVRLKEVVLVRDS